MAGRRRWFMLLRSVIRARSGGQPSEGVSRRRVSGCARVRPGFPPDGWKFCWRHALWPGYDGVVHTADSHDLIRIHGARENNLKNVSLAIPKRRLTVFTGVSGSGKSSLVFDTIAA